MKIILRGTNGPKKNMPDPMSFFNIAVVKDTIYLIGGMNNFLSPPVSNGLADYPDFNSYFMKKEMPTARGCYLPAVSRKRSVSSEARLITELPVSIWWKCVHRLQIGGKLDQVCQPAGLHAVLVL